MALAYCEKHEDKHAAMRREWEIKRLARGEKLALCEMVWERSD